MENGPIHDNTTESLNMTVHLRNVSMLNPFVRLFSGLNTAEEEEKEEKHIHVWREKVGQFNQSKDNEST